MRCGTIEAEGLAEDGATRRGARPVRPLSRPREPAIRRPALADGMEPPIDDDEALDRAILRLRAADPAFVDHLLAVGGRPPLRRRAPGFAGLAAIVVGQQVSTASAAAIFGRLETALAPLAPATMLAASDAVLRTVGLSAAKVKTLRAAALAVEAGTLPMDALPTLAAEAAHAALVAVPGIGPWTADLFLLFCLGHPDAWPAGDLALQEAARTALGREARPGPGAMTLLAERWRPHRAVAARLLWAYYRAIKGRAGVIAPPA